MNGEPVRTPAGLLVPPESLGGVPGINVAKAQAVGTSAPPRIVHVDRRTWRGLQPRPRKPPTTAEDSAALRKAELKRQRKARRRLANLPDVGGAP
ncbi:MAG: hypothetical protein U9Q74_08540 [Gemmatimonadota bacterium]|nr:hypothetical protein [Gemmatimonadota bacterium]